MTAEVDRHHAAFVNHKHACDKCSPVPTVGPCPTGLELRAARDATALDFLEDTVRNLPGVDFTCRNPRGETIVHFTAPAGVQGGVAYHQHSNPQWMVVVGRQVGGTVSRHASERCGPERIRDAMTELVASARGVTEPLKPNVPLSGMPEVITA